MPTAIYPSGPVAIREEGMQSAKRRWQGLAQAIHSKILIINGETPRLNFTPSQTKPFSPNAPDNSAWGVLF